MEGSATCHNFDPAGILGLNILLPMGCVKLGEKIAFTCLLWVSKPQINYSISRNPWEVIISSPVLTSLRFTGRAQLLQHCDWERAAGHEQRHRARAELGELAPPQLLLQHDQGCVKTNQSGDHATWEQSTSKFMPYLQVMEHAGNALVYGLKRFRIGTRH